MAWMRSRAGGAHGASVFSQMLQLASPQSAEMHCRFASQFDMVISNQVFEYIPDPTRILPEIARVLKPGGQFLALFPFREIWYEGHLGLYFAHWLQTH